MNKRLIDLKGCYIRLLNNTHLKVLYMRGCKVTEILSQAVVYRCKGQSCTLRYQDMTEEEFDAVVRKVDYIKATYPEMLPLD